MKNLRGPPLWKINVYTNHKHFKEENKMEFFQAAIEALQTIVIALGAALGTWGGINLLEGYGSDNPSSNAHVR